MDTRQVRQLARSPRFLLLLAPLILLTHLLLLSRGEIILDVKGLPDLLRSLALDHVGNSFAGYIEKALDVKIIGSQDELKEGSLIYLEEISVPGGDVIRPLLLVLVILRWRRVILVISGPGDNLLQNGSIHIG